MNNVDDTIVVYQE